MNKKKLWVITCLLAFAAAIVPARILEKAFSQAAQGDDSQILALEGLKGVSIQVVQPVSGFEDRPKFNPVNVDDLHTSVKRLLNEAGIEVVQNASDDPEIGHVVVTINVWKDRIYPKLIVQIKTELYQLAQLVRDTGLQIMVPTWPLGDKALEAETLLIVTHSELARTVQDEVQRQTKIFVRDYREANPTPEPKPDLTSMMTGTIRYVNLEGGYYNIVADNGKEYHPVNLPHEYRRHGLRVAFKAIVMKVDYSFISGTFVKITKITKL